MNKKALIIGGGGTLGMYTADELLRLGHSVDIICLEDRISDNEKLVFYKQRVTPEFLKEFFADRFYDCILDLIHHSDPDKFIGYYELVSQNTDHFIFTSSIRAVGDTEHPVTENSMLHIDMVNNPALREKYFSNELGKYFIEKDDYGLSKGKCEKYLLTKEKKWTVIRPVISSSHRRLDILMHSGDEVVRLAREGKIMYQPEPCRNLTAGVDWAGNSGKIIANLMFKEQCKGEAYIISTGHRMTWEDVVQVYIELLGVKVQWLPLEEYTAKTGKGGFTPIGIALMYDRAIDNSKMLAASGLKKTDFTPFEQGIEIELKKLGAI